MVVDFTYTRERASGSHFVPKHVFTHEEDTVRTVGLFTVSFACSLA